jgi:hypothetical protein
MEHGYGRKDSRTLQTLTSVRRFLRNGRSRVSGSPSPGEGKVGCVFDEISNLVEPTERQHMGEPHAGERRHWKSRQVRKRSRKAERRGAGWVDSYGRRGVAEQLDQTKNSVKVCLTAGQGLRLLCIGGRCNLFTAIKPTENSHDKRKSYRPDRAGAVCRGRYDRFGSCFPVCDAGRVVRETGALKLFVF